MLSQCHFPIDHHAVNQRLEIEPRKCFRAFSNSERLAGTDLVTDLCPDIDDLCCEARTDLCNRFLVQLDLTRQRYLLMNKASIRDGDFGAKFTQQIKAKDQRRFLLFPMTVVTASMALFIFLVTIVAVTRAFFLFPVIVMTVMTVFMVIFSHLTMSSFFNLMLLVRVLCFDTLLLR